MTLSITLKPPQNSAPISREFDGKTLLKFRTPEYKNPATFVNELLKITAGDSRIYPIYTNINPLEPEALIT